MLARLSLALRSIDWVLAGCVFAISCFGLATMHAFGPSSEGDPFFTRQVAWLAVSLFAFVAMASVDYRFLRRTPIVVAIYGAAVVSLLGLYVFGSTYSGAQSWYNFGFFAFQPVEFAKMALIVVLAKYFSRRHVEIARIRHVIVSGAYAFILFALLFLQPDFGSAMLVFAVWLGMVMVSGISKKHLAFVATLAAVCGVAVWGLLLDDYQKNRISTFLDPLSDIRGAGYNAYQATITVGSGQLFGKGVGFGTQSRLKFLPEYETDFVFAAFAEEWGFVGVVILFVLWFIAIWRIVEVGRFGESNFESLYAYGLALLFMSHFTIHVGMNIGEMPVTGLTFPFMSYGGTHLLVAYAALGILMGMRRNAKPDKRMLTREIELR
jgi:rod shape determining protein RodA